MRGGAQWVTISEATAGESVAATVRTNPWMRTVILGSRLMDSCIVSMSAIPAWYTLSPGVDCAILGLAVFLQSIQMQTYMGGFRSGVGQRNRTVEVRAGFFRTA